MHRAGVWLLFLVAMDLLMPGMAASSEAAIDMPDAHVQMPDAPVQSPAVERAACSTCVHQSGSKRTSVQAGLGHDGSQDTAPSDATAPGLVTPCRLDDAGVTAAPGPPNASVETPAAEGDALDPFVQTLLDDLDVMAAPHHVAQLAPAQRRQRNQSGRVNITLQPAVIQ